MVAKKPSENGHWCCWLGRVREREKLKSKFISQNCQWTQSSYISYWLVGTEQEEEVQKCQFWIYVKWEREYTCILNLCRIYSLEFQSVKKILRNTNAESKWYFDKDDLWPSYSLCPMTQWSSCRHLIHKYKTLYILSGYPKKILEEGRNILRLFTLLQGGPVLWATEIGKNISITLVCRNATWRFQKQVIGSRRLCFPTQLHSCHPDQNLLCEFRKSRHGSTNTKLTLWVVLVDTNAPFMITLRISRKGAYMVCWESTMDVFSYEMTEHIPEKCDSFGSVHTLQTRLFPHSQSIFLWHFRFMM